MACTWVCGSSSHFFGRPSSSTVPSCRPCTSSALACLSLCTRNICGRQDHGLWFQGKILRKVATVRSWSRKEPAYSTGPSLTCPQYSFLFRNCTTDPPPSPPQAGSFPGPCTRSYCHDARMTGIARRAQATVATTLSSRLHILRHLPHHSHVGASRRGSLLST